MSWEQQVVERMGTEGIRELVRLFYLRVRKDDLMGPMYPQDDWEGAERRLADFLCFRLAGETRYLEERGHPRLRMRHFPFRIGEAERDRWLELMRGAMDEVGLAGEERAALEDFFARTADFMRNQPAEG